MAFDGKNVQWELVGLVEHSGQTVATGRYRAFARHTIEGRPQWFKCTDGAVLPVEWEAVRRVQAYALVYRKAEVRKHALCSQAW